MVEKFTQKARQEKGRALHSRFLTLRNVYLTNSAY
jgi:hypothetical protein